MRDYESTDLEGASYLARMDDIGYDDRPTLRECEADEHLPPYRIEDDEFRGVCGGCSRPVSAGDEGGSCIWTGGPWHPSCRDADLAASESDADADPFFDIIHKPGV